MVIESMWRSSYDEVMNVVNDIKQGNTMHILFGQNHKNLGVYSYYEKFQLAHVFNQNTFQFCNIHKKDMG